MLRPAIASVLLMSPVAHAAGDFTLPTAIQSSAPTAYDAFGSDVAVHAGSLMFVGVRGADAQGLNAGAVEIFQRSTGGWTFLERPVATGLAAGDQLGESVAGNATWLAAGASRHDAAGTDSGAVWVFRKGATNWAFAQKLTPAAGSAGARFGAAVAVSNNAVVAAAPAAANGGAVMPYRLVSNVWTAQASIANPTPAAGDRFGDSIALTDSYLAVGDPFDDTRGVDAGAVYIFVRTPTAWFLDGTILPTSTAAGQHFGQSVSLSGTRLAIGAYGADTGAYESGRVDIYDRTGAAGAPWSQTGSVEPDFPVSGGNFGWDVSLDGSSLAVGAPGAGLLAFAGEMELFARQADASWLPLATGRLVGSQSGDVFGSAVVTSSGQLVAAAPAAHPSNGYRGKIAAADLSADCNANSIPDIFDIANGAPDCDSDGILNACESDSDGDTIPDDCDGCPTDPNKTAPGTCGCGVADTDTDSDGTPDCNDGCPTDPNKTAPGTCGCGVADTDTDSDGTPDCNDGCPTDPNKTAPGTCGCGVADTDTDSDGTPDCNDGCPTDPNKTAPGTCGCGVADTDTDGDGTLDCTDGCPTDPNKIAPGTCGCGVADTDTDSDGTPDCNDGCPTDPNKTAPGTCGCGVADTDTDGDGAPDCNDGCPTDPNKTAPGTCGCGVADTDTDSDGTPDCNDGCPTDPNKTAPGTCGCGVADTDTDGDGTPDCTDGCPSDPTNQCDLVFDVPAEYSTIQAAIDAAPSDRASVVQVAAGTYNEQFELLGKDVVVRGAPGFGTVLSGLEITGSIARFSGGEPATAGVEQLLFRNGQSGSLLDANASFRVGGALFGSQSSAFIRSCRFEQCTSGYGGAVYLLGCTLQVEDCVFASNLAHSEGGAVLVYECAGPVRYCAFTGNRCAQAGPGSGSAFKSVGGRTAGAVVLLDHCTVQSSNAGVSGSAIEHFENATPGTSQVRGVLHISNCMVQGNSTLGGAAGIRILGTMQSCVLMQNTLVCSNTPRNVSGPYFNDGTAGVCDCTADFNGDGVVDGVDLAQLLASWGLTGPSGSGDVTHNGTVDANDLAEMLSLWGGCSP